MVLFDDGERCTQQEMELCGESGGSFVSFQFPRYKNNKIAEIASISVKTKDR